MKKILIAGATGNLGPHLVKAFVNQGHQVSAIMRQSSLANPDKTNPLKDQGVALIEADLEDDQSLLTACEDQQIVISALGGGQILQQVNLAKAAKVASAERFIPSEFGVDPIAAGSGSCDLFDAKAAAQEQIKAVGIPYTMIYTNGFMEFWGTGLGQLGAMAPPDSVQVFGSGNVEAFMTSLADIAEYTCAIIDDPSTENHEIYVQANKISQNELINTWERLSGKTVEQVAVAGSDLDKIIDSSTTPETMMQRIFTQLHRSVWVRGDTMKIRSQVLSAHKLYPQINPISIEDYFSNFLT